MKTKTRTKPISKQRPKTVQIKTKETPNKSFCSIAETDLYLLFKYNRQFNLIMESGAYVLADNYICLNSPAYMETKIIENKLILKEIVRSSPEEYCLSFIPHMFPPHKLSSKHLEILNRSSSSIDDYEKQYYSTLQVRHAKRYEQYMREKGHADILLQQNNSFLLNYKDILLSYLLGDDSSSPQNFLKLIIETAVENQKTSIPKLANEIGIGAETIRRFWKKPESRPKIENVVAVCLGLHLRPAITTVVLVLAGYVLRDIPQERAYLKLISTFYEATIKECNNLLLQWNLEAMTSRT